MEKKPKSANIEKFMKLPEDKRDRILNAAMKEFRYGFKKASTDAIVKDAGISKGLLYHYFSSKLQLYDFLINFINDIMQRSYNDLLNNSNRDILMALWQSATLRREINKRYPYINEFSDGAYAHLKDIPEGMLNRFIQKQEASYSDMLMKSDLTKLRDDIDPTKAIDLIFWSIEGFFEYSKITNTKGENDSFLEDLLAYLDIFRLCFYKK